MKNRLLYIACMLFPAFSVIAQPVITHIEPPAAIPGSIVTLHGFNFETTPANNTVTFAGVTATVISATATRLVVTVPVASTGPGDIIVTSFSLNSLAFNFTVLSSFSPGLFGKQDTITTIADGAVSVYAADLDGDGDMDILSASRYDSKIAWYKNDGDGVYNSQPNISTTVAGALSVYAADLDGDGDMDVLSAAFDQSKIAWFENTDGAGGFGPQQDIATGVLGANTVYAADLDGDGDMDVLSASPFDNKIAWYENDGAGGFTVPTTSSITTSAVAVKDVYAADLDGDGNMDVLSASRDDDKVAWYKNDGSGGFTTQPAITTTADGANAVYAADLDGDGDLDVLSASQWDNKIAWYENDGSGGFTIPSSSMITIGINRAISVYASDLDGDGDMDVLSASFDDDKIAWYMNDGAGGFTAPLSSTITTAANGAQSVFAADLDGDGDIDVLSASGNDDKIAWYANHISNITRIEPIAAAAASTVKIFGNNINLNATIVTFSGTPATIDLLNSSSSRLIVTVPDIPLGLVDIIITSPDGKSAPQAPANFTILSSIPPDVAIAQTDITTTADGAWSAYAADLDGDGDMDVLSASVFDDRIAWYENDGTGGFTIPASSTITNTADWVQVVYASDLDGDGDMDVLSASVNDSKIAWYENDGAGGFSLPATSSISTTVWGAQSLQTADLNGDGDLDVLSAFPYEGKVVWFENDGAGGFSTPTTSIITNIPETSYSVHAADLDGDGDLDVLSASLNEGKVTWYENDGIGGFTTPASSDVTIIAAGATSVYAADLDEDGDMDVLSASQNDNKIAWYENTDGAGSFGIQQVITSTASGASLVYAADLDGDGDMDVLTLSSVTGLIVWYENDGAGNFTAQPSIYFGAKSVYAADLDGDGDLDILSAFPGSDRVAWYKRSFNGNDVITFFVAEETTNKVIDNVNNTVAVEVANGTDLTAITPTVTFSPGTTVGISSTDYSSVVTYTVTSEIGVSQDWLVNIIPVTDAPTLSLSTTEQTTTGFSWNQSAYVKGYNLDVSTDAAFSGFMTGYPKNITDAATLSESLSGLAPGTQYYARIRSYNQFNTESVNSGTLSILTVPTEPVATVPASITSTSFQTSLSQVTGADYYILEVSSNDFATLTLRDSISDQLLADATGLTPLTEYKFRLKAGNNSGVSGYSNVIMITTPFTAEESPTIPFELFGGRDDTWNLFSIPYELDNKSISSIFADYDPARHEFDWRIVRYRSNTSDYVNFNTGQVNIGEAYWFNAKENLPVKVGAGQVNSQIPFTKLLSQGWNLIGNPYRINISWEQVLVDNPASIGVESLQVFKGTAQSAGNIMKPFSGGFVWSDQAASMVIDPRTAGSGGRISGIKRKIASDDIDMSEWLLDINLITNDGAAKLGGFGMHAEALELKDRYDGMSVPRFFSYTDLFTEHQEYFYPWFATDVVPTTTSYTWSFTLASNQLDVLSQIKWDQQALQGKKAKLYLLDKASGKLIDMKQQGSHIIDLSSGEYKFAIYFTAGDQPLLPNDLLLGTAYPNPASTITTIPVVLPAGSGTKHLNLAIYNLNGKLITTLADGYYAPGVHEFIWDISENAWQSVSGMFIYRLLLSDMSIPPMQKKLIIR
jgi:FG-GAP-like repeat/IPT/TIG domain